MAKIIAFIVCLLIALSTLEAQQVVTGQITNEQDGTPIHGASVFIAHTTIGTHSDNNGNFSITVPIQGNFIIVVSHIGFWTASRTIDRPQPSHQINFALQENILPEVVVTPCIPHGRVYEDFFWRTILGERPSNRGVQVLNPEVVQFCLNANGIFRAFADEPIEIINHNMGYHILYIFQGFEHYGEKYTFRGLPFFTELTPQNNRQRNRWDRRRQEVYPTSLVRFLRSLYQEQLYEDGFVLLTYIEDNGAIPLQTGIMFGEKILIPLSLTQADSIRMEIPLSDNQTAAVFSYSHILQRDTEAVQFNTEQPIYVTFTSQPITYAMFRSLYRIFNRSPLLIEFFPLNITIFSDGSLSGTLDLQEHRGTASQLRTKLPLDFRLSESAE